MNRRWGGGGSRRWGVEQEVGGGSRRWGVEQEVGGNGKGISNASIAFFLPQLHFSPRKQLHADSLRKPWDYYHGTFNLDIPSREA